MCSLFQYTMYSLLTKREKVNAIVNAPNIKDTISNVFHTFRKANYWITIRLDITSLQNLLNYNLKLHNRCSPSLNRAPQQLPFLCQT